MEYVKEGIFLFPQAVEPRTIWMGVSATVTGQPNFWKLYNKVELKMEKEFKWVDGRLCR
jgi:hypothetical protein